MERVSQQEIKEALELWHQAVEQARYENERLSVSLKIRHSEIQSMIENGWLPEEVKRCFEKEPWLHDDALLTALKEVDKRYR